MAKETFETVERPGRNVRVPLLKALIKTVHNGKALRFPLNGTEARVIRNWVGWHAAQSGFKGHCFVKDGHAIAWFTAKEVSVANPDYCPKCGQKIGPGAGHQCPMDKEPEP